MTNSTLLASMIKKQTTVTTNVDQNWVLTGDYNLFLILTSQHSLQ